MVETLTDCHCSMQLSRAFQCSCSRCLYLLASGTINISDFPLKPLATDSHFLLLIAPCLKTWSVLGLCLELHFFISFLHSLFFKGFLSFYYLSMVVTVQVMELDPITSEEWAEKRIRKGKWRDSWKKSADAEQTVCVRGYMWVGVSRRLKRVLLSWL